MMVQLLIRMLMIFFMPLAMLGSAIPMAYSGGIGEAFAPEETRISTDESTCVSIESCVNAALAEENIYKQTAQNANGCKFFIRVDDSGKVIFFGKGQFDLLAKELGETLASLKNPKENGKNSYLITIECKKDTSGAVTIGNITVQTSAFTFDKDNYIKAGK